VNTLISFGAAATNAGATAEHAITNLLRSSRVNKQSVY